MTDLPDDYYGDVRLIVTCRECGKLLKAPGQWENDQTEPFVMGSGYPVFGKCPSTRKFPGCIDKMADEILAIEE